MFFRATVLASLVSTAAFAQDMPIEPVTAPVAVEEAVDNTAIIAYISPVCDNIAKLIVSDSVSAACAGDVDAMPSFIADGSRLAKRGIGAEIDTLIANAALFVAIDNAAALDAAE